MDTEFSYLVYKNPLPNSGGYKMAEYLCVLCGSVKGTRVRPFIKSCGCHRALSPRKDITGEVINNIRVIGYISNSFWRVEYACGCTYPRKVGCLHKATSGLCFSCKIPNPKVKHGYASRSSADKTYQAWCNMKSRCYNPSNNRTEFYRGKGIKVCNSWKDNFANFLRDMGDCPDKMTLERLNLNGDYCQSNCVWESGKVQANNKRPTIRVEKEGVIMSLKHWCDLVGVNYKSAHYRFRYRNESIESILGPKYTQVYL